MLKHLLQFPQYAVRQGQMAGLRGSSLDWFYQHVPDQLEVCGHGKHLQIQLVEPFHKLVVFLVLLLVVQDHHLKRKRNYIGIFFNSSMFSLCNYFDSHKVPLCKINVSVKCI